MTNFNLPAISNMLFLTVETVREFSSFTEFQNNKDLKHFRKVASKHYDEHNVESEFIDGDIYLEYASLYAEYAKVVSVGFGLLETEDKVNFVKKLYHISNDDEAALLKKLSDQLVKAYANNPNTILCGHNIIEFTIPTLVKRMIKHGIKVPTILQNAINGKPWEIKVTDTMREWKFGSNRYTSLSTIAEFLGIDTSTHCDVLQDAYWNPNIPNSEKIKTISEKSKNNVSTTMDVVLKLYVV